MEANEEILKMKEMILGLCKSIEKLTEEVHRDVHFSCGVGSCRDPPQMGWGSVIRWRMGKGLGEMFSSLTKQGKGQVCWDVVLLTLPLNSTVNWEIQVIKF